jgi:predicted GNAT family N-acyltransferase
VTYALSAIGMLVLSLGVIAWLGWRRALVGQRLIGELVAENRMLSEGVEVQDRAGRVLAENVASGGRLRSRLLARALRELPDPGPNGQASSGAGADSGGD